MRREYIPPPEVMALIEAQQRGELPPCPPISMPPRQNPAHHQANDRAAGPYQPAQPALVLDDVTVIPLYDVRAAAGHGAMVDQEEVLDFRYFSSKWIRRELHAAPNDLYLINVSGESMEPSLSNGDIILVDHRDRSPAGGSVYVLRMDGHLMVKRLQLLPGGVIKATSDNPAYEPFTLKLSEMREQDFEIIGRVVWTGRRM